MMTTTTEQQTVAICDRALDHLTGSDNWQRVSPELRVTRCVRELAAWGHPAAQPLLQMLLCVVVDHPVELRIALAVRQLTAILCEAAQSLPRCELPGCNQPVYDQRGVLVCTDSHVQNGVPR